MLGKIRETDVMICAMAISVNLGDTQYRQQQNYHWPAQHVKIHLHITGTTVRYGCGGHNACKRDQ
ncbi:MAG: hypothetical protein GY792_04135 [Gammaproteobacteria bacterium]|nr:hypothetical protein [Gammaproteobacteria bacterium]